MRRSMRVGLWVCPSFALLDAYMCFVVYPGAPFALILLYRSVMEAVLWQVYRASLRPGASAAHLEFYQSMAFFVAALGIACMAIPLGGLHSPYMHGISLVCLVHAAIVPAPWRRSRWTFLAIGLAYPIVMGMTAVLFPATRADWYIPASLAAFASQYVFVVASSIVGMASGHAVWAAQQQVYRARQLGRYRLEARIGSGGMGEVWLAWDGTLRRQVALKLLRANGAATPASLWRFEREAHAASQLSGPHTIRVYDFGGSDDGIYYIAMECLTGADLHSLVRKTGPLSPARAVRFAVQACTSLEEAHAAGIIHRDIKPQNLFATHVGDDPDFLKLLDFGIARFHHAQSDPQLTQPGFVSGTPAFMAPELWHGVAADARSDIYALGATLYFLLVGSPPFEDEALDALHQAHVDREPPRLSGPARPRLPAELEQIVLRCLAKSPALRYQSVRELRVALADLGDLPVGLNGRPELDQPNVDTVGHPGTDPGNDGVYDAGPRGPGRSFEEQHLLAGVGPVKRGGKDARRFPQRVGFP